MIYQNWINNTGWEQSDPKLKYLYKQPLQLSHTSRLVEAIQLQPSGILIVRGPRQTGKSTFLRQFIKKGLMNDLEPENIGLIEAETLDTRHELLGILQNFRESHSGYCLLCIDEITSIEKWWQALKIAFDDGSAEDMLILCTGSSTLDLSEGADLLPGRRGRRTPVDFELLPVCYNDVSSHLSLEDFFLTGGFPWAINEFIRSGSIPQYVYELYSAWIQGALLKKKHSVQHLFSLLNYLVKRSGTGLSVANLARDCSIGSNHTAEAYLQALELNYIILVSHWTDPGTRHQALRKNRKFYPADPFLFHLFHENNRTHTFTFENSLSRTSNLETCGALAECLVASELRHHSSMMPIGYFLGKKEIDFIGDQAIEVKYQNHVSTEEFGWIEKVIPTNIQLTVITKNTHSVKERIRLVPLKTWLIETGHK